ncbi:hypothetical protein FQN50_006667 [Emmonsiellopsis sp. PD_5]|nr:hypothetical protein FQN50_006667 [Emmonsiellopsis sp. PD_5]
MREAFIALCAVEQDLKKKGIPVVEYGDILNARFGYPICVETLEWLVPDNQLQLVSTILLDHHIPRGGFPKMHTDKYRVMEGVGIMHYHAGTRIHLLPLSYARLTLDDCIETVSGVSRNERVLVPNPRAYFISLIHLAMVLPEGTEKAYNSINFGVFLEYYVFPRLPEGEEEEDESEEHFQQRVEQAISYVNKWEWKPEEEKYLRIAERVIRDCSLVNRL